MLSESSKPVHFQKILFGYASAEKESVYDPGLLLSGFYRRSQLIDPIIEGNSFLVLGDKGSGKTAVGEHLRLQAEGETSQFVSKYFLKDFPFRDLKEIIRSGETTNRYPTAWSWILLLLLFGSFSRDNALVASNASVAEVIEIIKGLGLLDCGDDLAHLVTASRQRSLKITVPPFLEGTIGSNWERDKSMQVPVFSGILKDVASKANSQSHHMLVIDGLDDVFSSGPGQWDALAGLIVESARLNDVFKSRGQKIKIVVLCRLDVYEMLPDANKNKIRQDYAVEIEWKRSELLGLLLHRATLSDPTIKDLFDFFPQKLGSAPVKDVLLAHTRYIPRDVIQLFSYIQKAAGPFDITAERLGEALSNYSRHYFLSELKDEFSGFYSQEDISVFFPLIRSVGTRYFTFEQIRDKASKSDRAKMLNLEGMLVRLFSCGGLGNARIQNGSVTAGCDYVFHNREMSLDLESPVGLHLALARALKVGRSRSGWSQKAVAKDVL